ncbi:Oidioi.mRNA.OKI2018_I69.PAR.g9871.t1.cds [Oikopleura dioica]|uniref:Oidioi.mRNA.OKI2018_I69.PAR.g9871.t1.cds n=1 Tax=Oikopleura dioica TaxID=34765 RepID=A0ABN7RNM4_OIKDI|nr:Oidioi.mRNA.OKI2018_I69.PAR.g9871.t1.cds [Oikopleura dioica]
MGENRGKFYVFGGYDSNYCYPFAKTVEFLNGTRWSIVEGVEYGSYRSGGIVSTPNGIFIAQSGRTIVRFDDEKFTTVGHVHHTITQFLSLNNILHGIGAGQNLQRIFIEGDQLKAFEYDVIPNYKISVEAKYINCI